MPGVVSTVKTDLRLANVPARQVTSNTRFNWSKQEVSIFESFIREHRITSDSQKTVDLQPLLSSLNLDQFLSIENTNKQLLRPIIETKVRRKLSSVVTNLKHKNYADSVAYLGQCRTRLQAARTRAISAGEKAPTELPRPDPIYTPEIWKPKARSKPASSKKSKSAVLDTVEKAKEEVVRLEQALALARAKLSQLQEQEQQQKQDGPDNQLIEEYQQQQHQRQRPMRNRESTDTSSPEPSHSTARPLHQEADATTDPGLAPEVPSKESRTGESRRNTGPQRPEKTLRMRRLGNGSSKLTLAKTFQNESEDDTDAGPSAPSKVGYLRSYLREWYGETGRE